MLPTYLRNAICQIFPYRWTFETGPEATPCAVGAAVASVANQFKNVISNCFHTIRLSAPNLALSCWDKTYITSISTQGTEVVSIANQLKNSIVQFF